MQSERIMLDEQSELICIPDFFSKDEADFYYALLKDELAWKSEKIKIFGKEYWQPRLLAWYADPGISYKYSGIVHEPEYWTESLSKIKKAVETVSETEFNSVLANFYRDGNDSMGWHSDNEKELGPEPLIASLSLGAARKFSFRPVKGRAGDKLSFELNSGSLLIMKGKTQEHFQHSLPKTANAAGRINLTFRRIFNKKSRP